MGLPADASLAAPDESDPASTPACAGPGAERRATLVVAGLSVRALAESARQAGWQVIALDLFGDQDTRRAARRWTCIGDPATLRIDPVRLAEALRQAARYPRVMGWVPGSGFEQAPTLLDAGADTLACLATPSAQVTRLRDARAFFAALDRLGLAHPAVVHEPPAAPQGWLAKRAGGCGGWHIRDAAGTHRDPPAADTYYQRFQPGVPMSALFLADGRHARLVALNRLEIRPLAGHPHVYCGAVGPVVAAGLAARIEQALAGLVPEFGLRGLASLDFVADAGTPWLLEINPRPSASMVLHAHAWRGGLLRAHVDAVRGRLPATRPRHPAGARGTRIVFAERACEVDPGLADALGRSRRCHDAPMAGTRLARGDPVCSVSAEAPDLREVAQVLERHVAQVHRLLETASSTAATGACAPSGAPHSIPCEEFAT